MNPTAQSVSLFITYVDKEGPFLKVWGQAEKNNSIYVEQFLLGASSQFDQGIGKIPFESLQVGALVCAKYKDNKYYRSKITSIDYLNQVFVEVSFIDYGNRDVVPAETIRSLQNFPTAFASIPPLATSFILAEAHCPGGGEWKEQIFDVIAKELRYREVQCHLITQATHYYLISLYIDGTDVGSLLINRGLLQPIHLNAQQAVLLSMSLERRPQPSPAQMVVSPTPEIHTFKACTLEPMQQYAVYVSFVNEGPTHFSVQLQQSEDMLAKLMKDINEINLKLLDDVPLPGTICLARCQEDQNVCRAVVTNEVDNLFKIFYVDFGNYETLPLECLYQIPFKYVLPKVMAIRVALNGVEKSTVTMEMLLAFKKFVDNRLLYMKVLSSAKKITIPKCELWDPATKTNALDVINRAAQYAYPEPLILNRGLTLPVKISYVFSCNRFYVQLLSKEAELEKLMAELQVSCQSSDPVYEIKLGLPCCALFEEDQFWYRSEIVEVVNKDNVRVRYIDYGNEEVVPVTNLKTVEGELLTVLRPQAIECCLNGYQNMGADETRDALLEELILEQNFTMRVNEMIGKKALVELIDSSNYNIASVLLDKVAASKSQVSPMLVQAGNTLEHRKSSDSSDSYRGQKKPARDWGRNERNDNRNTDRGNDTPRRNENRDTSGSNISWRIRQNDTNQNEGSSNDGASWRQNNKGFNRQDRNNRDWGDRNQQGERSNIIERFTKNRDRGERGGENRNSNRNNQDNEFQKSSIWNNSPVNESASPASDEGWTDATSPGQNSFDGGRKSREDKFGGRKKYDNRSDRPDRGERGGWKSRDGDKAAWSNKDNKGGWDKKDDAKGGWNKDGFNRDGFRKDFRKDGSELSSSGSEKSFRKGPRTSSRNDYGAGRGFQHKGGNSFDTNSWNVSSVSVPLDAAPNSASFAKQDVVGIEAAVVISWFHNPAHFYCQLQSIQPEFKILMDEIQQFYKDRIPESCAVGAPVVGLFAEDNVLYRAQILEVVGGLYKVFYVDFGNVSTITKVWPIDKKFMQMPAQGLNCGLAKVAPCGEDWPDPSIFSQYFGKEFYIARFLNRDENRTYVQLWDNQNEVLQLLKQANLIKVPANTQPELGVQVPLLLNQQFRVVLKSVNNLNDIIVALECGLALSCKAHNIERASESFEDLLKTYVEQILIMYVDNVIDGTVLDVTFYDNEGNKIVILTPDEGALDNVDPLCPPLVVSSTLVGYVSHATETSVFIQPNAQGDQITDLLHKLFQAYENVTEESNIIPEEGFVYAVHGCDGNWYRGRVDSFDDDNATVFYVDYGNYENVPFSSLRELKSEFNVPSMMCVQVSVTSGAASSFLDKNVVTSICYGDNGWEGALEEWVQPEKIKEQVSLTAEKIAQEQTVAVEVAHEPSPVTEQQFAEKQSPTPGKTVVAEIAQPGIPVFVSHIDSPTEFYIQFTETKAALEELQQQLQDTAGKMPIVENISVGVLCAAPYSLDHLWYRAEVLDADEDITTVRFIDYGNTDVISNKTTEIKTLPANLLSLAVYASRCSLKLKAIDEEWSEQALEVFEELTKYDNVTAQFIAQDEKTNIVEVYANRTNIKDVLIAQNLATPCEIGAESSVAKCFVSHLNSPSEFWVQMENCVNELEFIAEQLSGAEQFPELEDLTPGTLCAALFPDDDMWYRARILSNTVAGIELLFIDYGNPSVSSSLRQLPENLVVTPPLAQKCSLQRPETIPYWTKQTQDKFAELAADGATTFELNKVTAGETATVELLLNGENIVPKLLPVTEDGFVRNFESLLKFCIEKGEEMLPELYLEPMPNMAWDEESSMNFLKLYPNNTLFQVEFISDNGVRLYKQGVDIRINLGGVKTTHNLSNNESEKTEDLSASEDQVIDYKAGRDNFESQHSKQTVTEIIETTSGPVVYPAPETEDQNSRCSSELEKIADDITILDEDSGVITEQEIIKTGKVEKTGFQQSEDPNFKAEKEKGDVKELNRLERKDLKVEVVENESKTKIQAVSSEDQEIKTLKKEIVKPDDGTSRDESVSTKLVQKSVKSRPSSTERPRSRHDEQIIPGCVSRPQSPLPENLTEENKPASRPSSSQGRRISHDDKILPAVLSRPQTPVPEQEG
ncbi:maternal protein tudor isoform X2 [Euwallacea fornicatus]|uniref:maternal protein tudor isoform X2 n=1 Tax=Euwallacea fornicatus TaxID=995702 RepID=UPI00338D66A0